MGKTSIMVTHDIADAFKVGNGITVLNEGRVVFDGTGTELDKDPSAFINQFLAPFRTAVTAAAKRIQPVGVVPRPAPPTPGGAS
jgi:ABC-type proline/glycine betaine transport system ATPase subunit